MFEQYIDQDIEPFPENKQYRITFDNSTFKMRVLCKNHRDLELLIETFSVENPTYFFCKQYGYTAPLSVSPINKFGYFSPGLVFEIFSYLKVLFGSLSCLAISKNCLAYINDYLIPLKHYFNEHPDFEILNVSEDSGRNKELVAQNKNPYILRDYQKNSINGLLRLGYGRGLIEIPTGGGKSAILANLIWNINKQIDSSYTYLVFVPNKQLVEQMYKDFIDYGLPKSMITRFTAGLKNDDVFNPTKQIIIANRQYIFKNAKLLPRIDVLIADEVHQVVTAEASRDFVDNLHSCKLKFGCSGSLPRDKYKKWIMTGLFGKIVYTESITKLQHLKYISNLSITTLRITDNNVKNNKNLLFHKYSNVRYKENDMTMAYNDAYNAEIDYFNQHFNDLYSPVLKYMDTLNENVLVLFDKIDIGKNTFELAQKICTNKKMFYIDGSVPVDKRETIRNDIENASNGIIFGQSACVSTGINIKHLNHIIFLFNSKSYSRVLQSIGRTLRIHTTKRYAHLIDVVFLPFKYSEKHYNARVELYKEKYGIRRNEIEKLNYTIN